MSQFKIIAYYRVSTTKQGQSGLGLEAQQVAVEGYAYRIGASLVGSYTEVESGKNSDRPELQKALHQATITGSTLVISKLDRLSRNAAFLLTLRDSGVRFVVADMPDANNLTVGIMAVVAQEEREAISRRTKDALQAARARGIKLGNPNGAAALIKAGKGNVAGVEAIKAKADKQASNLRPLIDRYHREGITSLGAIAMKMNAEGIKTPRGGNWHKTSVKNLLQRLAA